MRMFKRRGPAGEPTSAPGGGDGPRATAAEPFWRTWTEVAEQFAEREILQDARDRAMPWAEAFADPSRLKDALHEAGIRDIQLDRREYRFDMTAADYLESRETAATGRFLRQMLGPEIWGTFRQRTQEVFADRFPDRFNDFREVILAIGHKP